MLTSRETLLSTLETLPDALFLVDDATTIVYANASAQTMLGASREQFLGNPFWRSAPQLVSPSLYQAVLKTRQTQEPTEVEYWSPITQTRLHVQLAPTMGGLTLQFHEVRTSTRRQEMVPLSEHLYADILETISDQLVILTPDGMVLAISQRPLEDAHLRREEVVGKPFTETPWWSYAPPVQQQLRAAIEQASRSEIVHFETRIRPQEGWYLDLAVTMTPHLNADRQVEYLIYTGLDITARKRAEEGLRVLIDAIPQFVWIIRPDGSAEYHNQRWCDSTNMTAEQAQGDGWLQAIHPDDQQRVLERWQCAVQTGRPYEAELRLRHGTTGEYRWFLVRGAPHRDDQGTILKWFGTATDIDEQKQAEQRIKASEENWRVLAETVPQLVWTARPDGALEYWNQRWYAYSGSSPEQALGHRWSQFLHPDDAQRTLTIWHHALAVGESYEIEYRLKEGQTGAYRWFLARGMPMRDAGGHILKWFGTCTDIHDKKQVEDEIRVLVDAIPQFVWMARPDGSCEYCNQRWCDYTGMTYQQYQGNGWLQAIHSDDAQHTLTIWHHALATGEPFEIEYRLKEGHTGAYRWFLARALPVRDETGQILKWFGTCTDIEEKKQAEQQLKESREHLRVLAETVPQLVWTARPDGSLEYWSQRWYNYTGASPEQSLGSGWSQFLHPDDYQHTLAIWRHARASGEPYEIEYRFKDGHTGNYRWFLARALPVRDEIGQIVKWFGTSTDIDDQKRIEEALRQSQEQANVLMNSSIIGIYVGKGEQIVDANDTFLRMTGYTREDLRAGRMNWMHMTPPDYLARSLEARQELATQQSMTPYEKEYVCKDGSRLPVVVGAVLLQHQPRQAIAFVLDNSARKELEQRKDDFISMASHELRNPLTALKLQTTLLHRQLTKQGLQASALSSMQTQINKLIRLVEDLLDVSKIQAGKLEYRQESVDLDALLREIVDTMQQTHPSHTILVRGGVQTTLLGDRDRLGQVFTNLLSNAIKYSPDAQTVEMDLSASPEEATIRVRDHGLGIPREQRDKIFDRFYRVTDSRKRGIPGLGMGLYIVGEIVNGHGGTITVDSDVGKGSTFRVTLPRQRT
ncbi:histidine kinase [Ktedonobacter sp. SOSP1-85]|nr:histidine kinase [Ktedonobacter sp. SOSP1-85]